MKKYLIVVFIFLTVPASGAPAMHPSDSSPVAAYLKPQTIAKLPDGRKVNFFCLGEGRPIAIIEPGWGGVPYEWRRVQPEFGKITKTCFFERPGYGFSDPGPLPRDSAADVSDLQNSLKATNLLPPYVLVSASLGGFNIRLFAYSHPDEVAGLLIQDPPAEQMYVNNRVPDEDMQNLSRCIKVAKTRPLVDGGSEHCIRSQDFWRDTGIRWPKSITDQTFAQNSRVSFLETLRSEDISMIGPSTDQIIKSRRPLGHIRLLLLQADTDCKWQDRTPKTNEEKFDVKRCAALADQVTDSTRGERRVVVGARHSVYDYKPDVVIGAFREVVEAARASNATAADR